MIGAALAALSAAQTVSGSAGSTQNSNRLDRTFARFDVNGDGQVSLAEFMAARQNVPGSSAESAEADTSTDTAKAARQALFSAIDTDSDGNVSKDEMSAYVAQANAGRSALLGIQELFGQGNDSARTGEASTRVNGHRRYRHVGSIQNGVSVATTGTGQPVAQAAAAAATASVKAQGA